MSEGHAAVPSPGTASHSVASPLTTACAPPTVDWTARMPAPYEVQFADVEALSTQMARASAALRGSEAYTFDCRLLARLVYRNNSQHRRGVVFQRVKRVHRTLIRLDALEIPTALDALREGLPIAPSGVRSLQLPTFPAFRRVLQLLTSGARLLRAAEGMCRRGVSAGLHELGAALFMPLNVVWCAVLSRLAHHFSRHLAAITEAFKTIGLCMGWSTSPDNASGVRQAAATTATTASSTSTDSTHDFFGVPREFDGWLAEQPSFDEGLGPDPCSQRHGTVQSVEAGPPPDGTAGTAASAGGTVVSRFDYRRTVAAAPTVAAPPPKGFGVQTPQKAVVDSDSEGSEGEGAGGAAAHPTFRDIDPAASLVASPLPRSPKSIGKVEGRNEGGPRTTAGEAVPPQKQKRKRKASGVEPAAVDVAGNPLMAAATPALHESPVPRESVGSPAKKAKKKNVPALETGLDATAQPPSGNQRPTASANPARPASAKKKKRKKGPDETPSQGHQAAVRTGAMVSGRVAVPSATADAVGAPQSKKKKNKKKDKSLGKAAPSSVEIDDLFGDL